MSVQGEGSGDSGGVRGFATAFFAALTRPLPRHIADFRESARTALIFAALVIVLGTLWIPHGGEVRVAGVLVLSAFVAATGVLSMVSAAHHVLNRFGGIITLLQITVIVALTGGPD